MTAHIALAVLGLVILVLAGDALVRGAVNLALRLGISALVVPSTIWTKLTQLRNIKPITSL